MIAVAAKPKPDPACFPRFADSLIRVRERARDIKRELQVQVHYEFCESCDAYHIVTDPRHLLFTDKNRRILELIAIGYRYAEIAVREEVGLTVKAIEIRVFKMQRRLGAMTQPHLIMLAGYLGLIKPTTNFPGVKPHE